MVQRPRHVLVVRTDHLGDMLLTLPIVDALKSASPECRVSVLASPVNAEAARHHPLVDHVEVDSLEAKGSGLRGLRRVVSQVRRLRCDAAVVAHPTPRLALALYVAGVPIRVGTAYRAYSFLFTHRVHEHRRRPPWQHESQYNVNLLRPLGVETTAAPPTWRVAAEESDAVEKLLHERGLRGEQLVIVHPGNAGSAMNWSPEQFGALGTRLVHDGMRVAITGGPGEVALTATTARAVGPEAIDLGGVLTLGQLAALLSRCAVYVGSATGPTHLAAAVGAPVVALYSPLRSSAPARWGPLGQRVTVLQPPVNMVCPTCLGSRCAQYHCMEEHLTVDAVVRAVQRLLGSGLAHP
jgi:ADP-heptose:LPS heptosyltransferase